MNWLSVRYSAHSVRNELNRNEFCFVYTFLFRCVCCFFTQTHYTSRAVGLSRNYAAAGFFSLLPTILSWSQLNWTELNSQFTLIYRVGWVFWARSDRNYIHRCGVRFGLVSYSHAYFGHNTPFIRQVYKCETRPMAYLNKWQW